MCAGQKEKSLRNDGRCSGVFLKNLICRFAASVGFFDKAMSEFKYACPVCGQHIMSDPGVSGAQIECPTCFQKIIVPKPPAPGSKFILSATQPIKPRAIPSTPLQQDPGKPGPQRKKNPTAGVLLVLICVAGAGIFIVNQKKSEPQNSPAKAGTNSAPSKPAPPVVWTLNLAGAAFPDWNAGGKIHDRAFVCDRAILQGGTLILRQGTGQPPELALNVFLSAKQGEELSGKSVNILPHQTNSIPRVALRWREAQQPVTETI